MVTSHLVASFQGKYMQIPLIALVPNDVCSMKLMLQTQSKIRNSN